MQTTFIFTGLVIVVALSVGLLTALLFNRPFRGRPLARAMLMMPWAFPEVPVVMIFVWILNPQFGVVNLLVRWIPGITHKPTMATRSLVGDDVDGVDSILESLPLL